MRKNKEQTIRQIAVNEEQEHLRRLSCLIECFLTVNNDELVQFRHLLMTMRPITDILQLVHDQGHTVVNVKAISALEALMRIANLE